MLARLLFFFFFSSRRRHTRCSRDWSSDVCSSDLVSFGPECFDLTGSNESRGCLQLRILGRTQGGSDSFRQADQRDSQNQDGTHDFHQRESCVPVHATYLRSSSTSRTRAVAGLMRKPRRKPSRSWRTIS